MFIGAYLEFAVILFLPGIAFSEAFKVGESLSLVERLGLCLGLGMSVNMLLFLIRMSGYFTVDLVVLSEGIAAVSTAAILVSFLLRRRLGLVMKPSTHDLLVGVAVLVQGLLVYAYYTKYPIFPQYRSIDFSAHVSTVNTILSPGPLSGTSLPAAALYYGSYMLMIQLIALSGGPTFVIVQRTVEILLVLSPLLVYAAASAVAEAKSVSLIATFIYVTGGFVWFASAFNAGLYPNLYGILSTLMIIVAISIVAKNPKSLFSWLTYVVSFANALFSHYSTLTLFPAIVALPVLGMVMSRKVDKGLVGVAVIPVIMTGVSLFEFPDVLGTLQGLATAQGGGNIVGGTPLSLLLSGYPFLSYMVAEITSDSSAVAILSMAVVGSYLTIRRRNPIGWIPAIWLLSVAMVSPLSEAAWRFSYAGLMPLCLLTAFGFKPLLSRGQSASVVKRRKGARRPRARRLLRTGAPIIVLILVVAGSWGTILLFDVTNQAKLNGDAQRDVYRSMLWMAKNTPSDSGILSVTDWRYLYTGLIAGRSQGYSALITPDEVVRQLGKDKDVYVALTRVWTLPNASVNPFPLYANDPRFSLVYNNPDVLIYRMNLSRSK